MSLEVVTVDGEVRGFTSLSQLLQLPESDKLNRSVSLAFWHSEKKIRKSFVVGVKENKRNN